MTMQDQMHLLLGKLDIMSSTLKGTLFWLKTGFELEDSGNIPSDEIPKEDSLPHDITIFFLTDRMSYQAVVR